jgi:hypothetical protein
MWSGEGKMPSKDLRKALSMPFALHTCPGGVRELCIEAQFVTGHYTLWMTSPAGLLLQYQFHGAVI